MVCPPPLRRCHSLARADVRDATPVWITQDHATPVWITRSGSRHAACGGGNAAPGEANAGRTRVDLPEIRRRGSVTRGFCAGCADATKILGGFIGVVLFATRSSMDSAPHPLSPRRSRWILRRIPCRHDVLGGSRAASPVATPFSVDSALLTLSPRRSQWILRCLPCRRDVLGGLRAASPVAAMFSVDRAPRPLSTRCSRWIARCFPC